VWELGALDVVELQQCCEHHRARVFNGVLDVDVDVDGGGHDVHGWRDIGHDVWADDHDAAHWRRGANRGVGLWQWFWIRRGVDQRPGARDIRHPLGWQA
jgi:hypothetical protein